MSTDFESLLRALGTGKVDFILVGGLAATVHGSARATYDIDVVYARGRSNLERIVSAIGPLRPYPRGAPPGLPFRFDLDTLLNGLNFTLTTALGDLDLLGEIVGGGTYEELLPDTIMIEVFGLSLRCLSLAALIRVKRAAGRPKDLDAIAELEALADQC